MKYVTVALRQRPRHRHPMHRFVARTEGYDAAKLLGSTVTDGHHAALFHVDGWPPGTYEAALRDVETVRQYALSTQADETFSVYVLEELRDYDRAMTDTFDEAGLVTWLPVVYHADGTIRLTLVGPSETVQAALASTPDDVSLDVRDVGSYEGRRIGGRRDLTDRQAAAVVAAVECGYYEDPRAGSVADVAAELDCAPSTAAEHLRRAERTVMRSYVETPGRRPA